MRRENVIGATLALLVLAGLGAHWWSHHPRSMTSRPSTLTAPTITPPISRAPPRPIELAPAPDDDATRALRAALAPSGVPLDTLGVLAERGGQHVYAIVTDGSLALPTWHGLRDHADASGHWPVVIGDGDQVVLHAEMRDYAGEPQAILDAASALDVEAWLRTRREQVGQYLGHDAWPMVDVQVSSETDLVLASDILTGQPSPHVIIALVPTRDGSEAPAWLGFGNYNDCPPSAVHVALFRRWHERWGAEVFGLSGDVAEMIVTRPPRDRAAALALADEQALYAYDVVAQGVESVEALAAIHLGGTSWYFWWD
jgi:hypothetical protein